MNVNLYGFKFHIVTNIMKLLSVEFWLNIEEYPQFYEKAIKI